MQENKTEKSDDNSNEQDWNTYEKILKSLVSKKISNEEDLYTRKIPGDGDWDAINEWIPSTEHSAFRLLIDNYGLEETIKHNYIVPMHGRLENKAEKGEYNFDEFNFDIPDANLSKNPFELIESKSQKLATKHQYRLIGYGTLPHYLP